MEPKLLAVVEEFLEEDDWRYDPVKDETAFRVACLADAGRWTCHIQTFEEREQVILYSILPVVVPDDKMLAVSEFLTRANYGLRIGNFEMDFDDGEVRYRTSIDVESGELTTVMVKNLLHPNVLAVDKYLPGINKIIHAGAWADVAIEEIETEEESEGEGEGESE